MGFPGFEIGSTDLLQSLGHTTAADGGLVDSVVVVFPSSGHSGQSSPFKGRVIDSGTQVVALSTDVGRQSLPLTTQDPGRSQSILILWRELVIHREACSLEGGLHSLRNELVSAYGSVACLGPGLSEGHVAQASNAGPASSHGIVVTTGFTFALGQEVQ